MKTILLVGLGGALGSVLRYSVSLLLNQQFPYGTMVVNILGSLLIGILFCIFENELFDKRIFLFLAVGFCGGFTTFSSFAAENFLFLQQQKYLEFSTYTLFSVILSIAAVALGFKLGKILV